MYDNKRLFLSVFWVILGAVLLVLSSLLFGSVLSMAYSASGAVLSLVMMAILKRTNSGRQRARAESCRHSGLDVAVSG